MAGGNVVVGGNAASGLIPFVSPAVPPAPQPTYHLRRLASGLGFKAVMFGGNIWTIGRNEQGELGRGGDASLNQAVAFGDNLVAVAAGEGHVLALQGDGQVWSWGMDSYGQSNGSPVLESGLSFPVVQIAAGGYTSYALDDQGQLWSKGRNHHGQAGVGHTSDVFSWTQVTVPGNVTDFAAGLEHLLVVVDGDIYGAGSDGFGQLGQASTSLVLIDDSRIYEKVAAGSFHSVALSDIGEVAVWGRNVDAQLGLGGTSLKENLQLIPGLSAVEDIAAGRSHTLILDSMGDVLGSGKGREDQLPAGLHLTPTVVPGWSNVLEIGAGPYSSMVEKDDGSVEIRGLNGATSSAPWVLSLP